MPGIPNTYWKHIEPAYNQISIYDGPFVLADGLAKYPSYVGDLLAVHWFLQEVENGGITQFFINPTGILGPEVIKGFANMGLQEVADKLRKCCAIFGATYPRDQKQRVAVLFKVTKTNTPWEVFAAELFKQEEDAIDALGRQIHLRMNDYLNEKMFPTAGSSQ